MGRGIAYWIFQRPRFCCCLPVRICVIIMALLGFILSGVLSVILWFEVASMCYLFTSQPSRRVTVYISQAADGLTSKERGAFVGGAIIETLFFLISSVGYVPGIHIHRRRRRHTLATDPSTTSFPRVQPHWRDSAQANVRDRVCRRAVRPLLGQPRRGGVPPLRHPARHAQRYRRPVPARDQQRAGTRPVLEGLQHHPRHLCSPSVCHPRH